MDATTEMLKRTDLGKVGPAPFSRWPGNYLLCLADSSGIALPSACPGEPPVFRKLEANELGRLDSNGEPINAGLAYYNPPHHELGFYLPPDTLCVDATEVVS